MVKRRSAGLLLALIGALVLTACSSAKPAATPAAPAAPAGPGPEVQALQKQVKELQDFVKQQTESINPGLGTVMIEYSQRMSKVWFAGEAENWDLATYNLGEMLEIQETGEIDRPKRADALKSFESKFLDPLKKTFEAKDKAAFETAYKAAVDGCNRCHVTTTSDDFKNGYGFIKFQVPKAPPVDYQSFAK